MQLKTYRGTTIADALAQVKQDLGRDAVILHTRMIRAGGWLRFRKREFVEITAGKGVNVRPRSDRAARERALGGAAPAEIGAPRPSQSMAARVSSASLADAYVRAPAGEPGARAGAPVLSRTPAVTAALAPVNAAAAGALEEELASIKSMVARVLSSSAGARAALLPDALHAMYVRLLEAEVAAEIADEALGAVREELGCVGCEDPKAVREAVIRALAGHIPVAADGPSVARAADGRPFTIALVGPTGVGKTTTLAKLAATYKLRQGRKVGLVTADTYRIAAVEQLRTYANIIGLPLQVAASPSEAASACAALSQCDCILIDTAGRSPRDADRLDELRALLDATRPHQTHLTLSSTSSEAALMSAAASFAPARPNSVIFTKLDEAVNFGVLVNVARRLDARLSWLTTGQEVPDAIEPGRADRLARLIVDGKAVG